MYPLFILQGNLFEREGAPIALGKSEQELHDYLKLNLLSLGKWDSFTVFRLDNGIKSVVLARYWWSYPSETLKRQSVV